MRILMLVRDPTWPPRSGASVAVHHLTRRLLERGHDLTIWSVGGAPLRWPDPPEGRLALVELPFRRWQESRAETVRAVLSPYDLADWQVRTTDNLERIRRLTPGQFDVCLVHHTRSAGVMPEIQARGIPCVLVAYDVEARFTFAQAMVATRLRDRAAGFVDALKLWSWLERRAVRSADALVALTESDLRRLARYQPRRSAVIQVGVDCSQFSWRDHSNPLGAAVLMTGSLSVAANIEACRRLRTAILPALRRRIPSARVLIVGQRPGPPVLALHAPEVGFEVVGPVDDIARIIHSADAFAIPLRRGSGMRVRAIEALACGVPMVATSLAVEGLNVEAELHYVRAETDREFVEALFRVLHDRKLRRKVCFSGRRLVEIRFDWGRIVDAYETLLDAVVRNTATAAMSDVAIDP